MSFNAVFSIRAATTVNSNTKNDIESCTIQLVKELILANNLNDNDSSIINIMCSTTADITAFYPVRAIRESQLCDVPLFSCLEPNIDGSLKLCIRLMVTVATKKSNVVAKHIYLNGAKVLRPDLLTEEK